ncbi:MAG: DUF6115 domain-containing protein [Velocimicrobium sp.]
MLDIFLVIVGMGFILISYIVSDKMDAKKNGKESEITKVDIWTEKDERRIKERIEQILADRTEEAMIKTDDQLSEITNEKIMAVSEFSNQILEKIAQNHTEVVFLYDMLNDKDREVKQTLIEINATKAKTEAIIKHLSEVLDSTVKKEKTKAINESPKTAVDMLEKSVKDTKSTVVKKEKDESVQKKSKQDNGEKVWSESVNLNRNLEVVDNKNAQILKLYEEGNSIIEIAKLLGLGQGEVKLVIDLFQGVMR